MGIANYYYTTMILETEDEWPWSDSKKRNFVWQNIQDCAQRSGSNAGVYTAYTVQSDEFSPVFLEKYEQRTILQDFDAAGKIRFLGPAEGEKHAYRFELVEPKRTSRNVFGNRITTLADLIKDLDIRERVIKIIKLTFDLNDLREVRADQMIQTDIHESEEELLLLMDSLDITQTDWESLKQQTHRVIGNRYVRVIFNGKTAKKFADAVSGRSSFIHVKALEQVATVIRDLMTQEKISDFFIQNGVPYKLIGGSSVSKKEMVYNVLITLSSTDTDTDKALLFHLLEELAHPLTFGGDTGRSIEFQYKITNVLRFNNLSILGGKMHEFSKYDEEEMARIKKELDKVDPELFNLIGTFFDRPAPVRPAKQSQPQQQPKTVEKNEQPTFNIHIHNTNEVTTAQSQATIPEISKKFPHKLPAGTMWENIIIKFLDDERVNITAAGKTHDTNFIDMGFAGGGKDPKPSVQWSFLKVLAEKNGEISITDKDAKTKYKKQKELLAKSLQQYFLIEYDPFYPYKSEASYRIKITLIPPEKAFNSRENGKVARDNDDDDNLGISEYYNEQTPSSMDD